VRQVVYWPIAKRLVYLDERATPEFWDHRWQAEGKPSPVSPRDEVVTVTEKYLRPGARILEGGCGRANKLKALAVAGFRASGVDFAEDSVRQARLNYPDLDIRQGDVRSLDFPDGHFDGYWSLGVIEHFWEGYDAILAEAARVLRPNGYLFLTAPWLSPYRARKVVASGYPAMDFQTEPDTFYQFALGRAEVAAQIARHGFELLSWQGLASEVSMTEEMVAFKGAISWLFRSKGSILKRALRRTLSRALNGYCGHSFLAVAQRGNS
jgi:SAM-dependent methyltransferase